MSQGRLRIKVWKSETYAENSELDFCEDMSGGSPPVMWTCLQDKSRLAEGALIKLIQSGAFKLMDASGNLVFERLKNI